MKLHHEIHDLPATHDFRIAREGARLRRSVVVRLEDDDGRVGWGEAAATPYYGETAESVAAVLPRLADVLDAAAEGDLFALERIEWAIQHSLGRNPSARAALSMALHDLLGQRLEMPVWKLWGLDPDAAPLSSFTLGLHEPDEMREMIREAAGYPILKVKVGTDRDEEVLQLIRDEAPDATIRVDANTGWTAKEALARLPMLEEFGIELIEQPLPPGDVEGFKLLRLHSPIPIIADESCRIAEDVPGLVGQVDGVNIKLAKCGSLREALRIVHVARAHHLMVMLGCMLETSIGIAAALQLAPLVDFADLDGAALLKHDPFRGPGLEPDGRLRFNTEPGLGVSPR